MTIQEAIKSGKCFTRRDGWLYRVKQSTTGSKSLFWQARYYGWVDFQDGCSPFPHDVLADDWVLVEDGPLMEMANASFSANHPVNKRL